MGLRWLAFAGEGQERKRYGEAEQPLQRVAVQPAPPGGRLPALDEDMRTAATAGHEGHCAAGVGAGHAVKLGWHSLLAKDGLGGTFPAKRFAVVVGHSE